MRKTRTVSIGFVFLLLLMFLTPTAAFAGKETELDANLTGAAEIPGPGDPDGKGQAEVKIKNNYSRLCYELKVSKILPATAAHVHAGAAGAAGPVVVHLAAPTNGKAKGCVAVDPALGRAIAENPAAYYVNVHNPAYPGGAVRGQLHEDD